MDMEQPASQRLFAENLHPRIFFGPEDIAILRGKATHPRMQAVLKETLQRCEDYCAPGNAAWINTDVDRTALIGTGANCGHLWRKLPDLLLAGLVTDDPRWNRKLVEILRNITTRSEPIEATIFGGGGEHSLLGVLGNQHKLVTLQCGLIPLMYDSLYNELAPAEQQAGRRYLEREVVEPFLQYLLEPGKMRRGGLGVNLNWWEFFPCVASLAAVYNAADARHRGALEMVADVVRRGIHLGVDETGIIGEGPFYGCIETFAWMTAAEILRRAGVCDLWSEEPLLHRLMQARLYYALPGRAETLDHGDTPRRSEMFGAAMMTQLLHASRTGQTAFQHAWEQIAEGNAPVVSMHAALGPLGFWLWFNPHAPPSARLSPEEWPLALGGGRYGLHIFRSSWEPEALYFAFFGAGRDPGTFIHQHVDGGHFALFALGEAFCAGRGYGHTNSKYHSVLQIEGQEPPDTPGNVGQMWRGGHNRAFAAGRFADYAAVDLAWQWCAHWYFRHALVVRAPGAEPYVLLLDNCNYNDDWGHYDWLMQVEPDCRVTLVPDKLFATVHGKKNRLELAWAHFRAADYPKPHRLELLTDEVESPYPKTDWRNNGPYQRLVARLHGYNGVLLAALIPRRSGTAPVTIERLSGHCEFGVRIHHGAVTDTVVVAPIDRRITIGGIDAEATLALVRLTPEGRVIYAAAADAFRLSFNGSVLMPRRGEPETLNEYIQE
ncbi:MAG: hypothetical protein HYV35_12005 [Lentisphaerae bacterium]|nr:hypothetical protein [Lentisphaerota bacterium]